MVRRRDGVPCGSSTQPKASRSVANLSGRYDIFGNTIDGSEFVENAMMVYPGEAYDVALKQPSGITRIKNQITPKRGEICELP